MLGEQIRFYRKKCNLSQMQLAEMVGVSHDTVSLWEKNRVIPNLLIANKMCIIFGITLDELLLS